MRTRSMHHSRLRIAFHDFLWKDRSDQAQWVQWAIGQLRAFYFALRGFLIHRLPLRAAGLAYVTLLSLVPVLALSFAAAKGLGIDMSPKPVRAAERSGVQVISAIPTPQPTAFPVEPTVAAPAEIAAAPDAVSSATIGSPTLEPEPPVDPKDVVADMIVPDRPPSPSTAPAELTSTTAIAQHWRELFFGSRLTAEQAEEIGRRINDYIARTNFGTLKAAGIILLILATILALGELENAFNQIWHVRYPRTFLRQFTDYLSVVVICPVLLAAGIAMTATLSSNTLVQQLYRIGVVNEMITEAFKYASYVSIWFALTALYLFMPNTRVRIRYALIGGLVAVVIWQIAFYLYAISMGAMNAVYATFAALPIFLTWLYVSWIIVLFGGEVAAAFQNRESYERELLARTISPSERLRLGLNMVLAICLRFRREESAWTADQLGRYLDYPSLCAEEILQDLTDAGILVASGREPPTYRPAIPLENITPARILEALQESRGTEAVGNATPEALCARTLIEQWRQGMWRELGGVSFDVLLEEIERHKSPPVLARVEQS